MRLGSVIACAAVAPLLIAASTPVRLQPSGPWVLDYAENSCRLSRAFGSGKDETVLQFESTAPGELSMLAIGRPLGTISAEIPARFLPVQDKPFEGTAQIATNRQPGVLWSRVALLPEPFIERRKRKAEERKATPGVRPPPIDLNERDAERAARQAFASAATALQIEVRRSKPVILDTGSLGEPIKAFDKCSRDSLRDWGIDPDLEDRIVRPVWAPNPAQWFSPSDYPFAMVREGKESEVKVRLLVDAAGNVTKCTSLSHFDAPEFNRIVCDRFVKRAKFEPAELADGTKVPSYYINRIHFRIEM